MGSFSIFHWLVVLVVILILFGAGRLPSVMGDLAKGIKAFRSGLKDDGEKPEASQGAVTPATVTGPTTNPAQPFAAQSPTTDTRAGVHIPPTTS